MKRLKTLRVRFALWTSGLLLVALILFGLFVYANMSRSLTAAVNEGLRLTTTQLVAEIDTRNGQMVSIDNFIEGAEYNGLREKGLSMRILSPTGKILLAYGPYRSLPQPRLSLTALDRPGEFTFVKDDATGHTVTVYTAPVVENRQVIGIIQVAQNLNDMRQTLNQLLTTLLIGGPLLVVIAGVGGYFLAARALNPIDQITRTARQISTEDLSARLNLPATDDEVGRLAATLDSMLTRLEDGFQRERRFVADASHELRTPVAAMQTILNSTLARQRTPAAYEQALLDLAQETDRMRTLTEGLLHLARNEADFQPGQFERVNLSTLLLDVTDTLRPLAEDKGLELICDLADDLTLMGDSDGLIRLFVNLLGNAIKYTEGGQITVTGGRGPEGTTEITITDTGIGIAAEHLPHLFDRFYRVDKSRSTDGSGLGLAIALNVSHIHNGTITVASEKGKGTSFKVQLGTG